MDQRDEPQAAHYPLGRGYGHDYMRGGEVFGGYGYSQREDYERPIGQPRHSRHEQPAGGQAESGDAIQTFDDHDRRARQLGAAPAPTAAPTLPEHFEHTFGVGGHRRHSRSYYVTQAQLQQRVYHVRADDDLGARPPISALHRDDAEIRAEVEDAIRDADLPGAGQVRVEVEQGIVILSGPADSPVESQLLANQAWAVPGVRDVRLAVASGDAG